MKTILVPIDYSYPSRQAFVFGLELAQKLDLNLVLFHAFHQPISVENAYHLDETILALEKEKKDSLKNWAKKVQNELYGDFCWEFNSTVGTHVEEQVTANLTTSGFHTIKTLHKVKHEVKIKFICKFGLAAEEIIRAAQTYKAGLILTTSRGAGPVGQTFLGSTVAWVIARSPVPVLTLPVHGLFKLPQSIVLATDLPQLAESIGFDILRKLVKNLQTILKVLHLYKKENLAEEQQEVQKGLETLDVGLYDVNYQVYLRRNPQVAAGIQDFMQQHQADMLVLIPERHPFLEVLLNISTTEKFIHNGSIPFLTLPLRSPENGISPEISKEQKVQQ